MCVEEANETVLFASSPPSISSASSTLLTSSSSLRAALTLERSSAIAEKVSLSALTRRSPIFLINSLASALSDLLAASNSIILKVFVEGAEGTGEERERFPCALDRDREDNEEGELVNEDEDVVDGSEMRDCTAAKK